MTALRSPLQASPQALTTWIFCISRIQLAAFLNWPSTASIRVRLWINMERHLSPKLIAAMSDSRQRERINSSSPSWVRMRPRQTFPSLPMPFDSRWLEGHPDKPTSHYPPHLEPSRLRLETVRAATPLIQPRLTLV